MRILPCLLAIISCNNEILTNPIFHPLNRCLVIVLATWRLRLEALCQQENNIFYLIVIISLADCKMPHYYPILSHTKILCSPVNCKYCPTKCYKNSERGEQEKFPQSLYFTIMLPDWDWIFAWNTDYVKDYSITIKK